jgi:hypothetical protein
MGPELGVGSEVIDYSAPAQGRPHGNPVADVGRHDFDLVEWKAIELRCGPIDNPHSFAAFHEQADEVRSNEPRPTSNRYRAGHGFRNSELRAESFLREWINIDASKPLRWL